MGWPFTGKTGLIENVYLRIYRSKNGDDAELCLKGLLTGTVSRMAFLSAYRDLPPIETIPEKERKESELYISELIPEITEEDKLTACKVLYTIGTLL